MEIRDLNYFRAVVSAGGVTNAAGLLHMTPGALSRALRRFEDEIGHQLLKRAGRKLVLTEVGRRLYERSERFLDDHKTLLADLDSAARPSAGMLRIASFEVFNGPFMAHVLTKYMPDADVEILEVLIGEFESAVLERRVDYAITTVPFPQHGVAFRRLGRMEVGVFGRPNAFGGVPFEQLPFVVPANPMRLSGREPTGLDGWPQSRVPRRVKYRVTMLQSGLELVARGMAVFALPPFLVALHNAGVKRSRQLVRYPSPPRLGRIFMDIQLLCRDEDQNDPRTKQLATMFRKALTEVSAMPVPTLRA
jgi:DNA-binding transcriptional LysR family regulator